MPVKFPSVHIAVSVRNRILNTWDELMADEPQPPKTPAAPVPPDMPTDTTMAGAQLEAQTQAPTPEMAQPEGSGLGAGVALGEDMLQNVGGGVLNTGMAGTNVK